MVEGIVQITPQTAALLLLAIALSAPSLPLMLGKYTQSSVQFQLYSAIGVSVLSASISLSFVGEYWELGVAGLACSIGGLLLSDGGDKNAASRLRTGIRMWASAAVFSVYLAYGNIF